MKLYRGLKTKSYQEFTQELSDQNYLDWQQIIELRNQGTLSYPTNLDKTIAKLHQESSLSRQYFTDDKSIAYNYATQEEGIVIEIDVPTNDILSYFQIEFQNYAKRKTQFELVYCIDAMTLSQKAKEWQLTIHQ